MTTINSDFIFNLGCDLGKRDNIEPGTQDSVAVLDFSFPICTSGDTSYGADLFGYGPVTMEQLGFAVKQFALGYYVCSGSDHDSNLVIGMGTNNKPASCDTQAKAAEHAAAWSTKVKELNEWAVDTGLFHQVQIYGASNMELGWNSPAWTRAWVNGFESVPGSFLLNFGDAAGCPYEDNPHWSCGTSTFSEWTPEDVWYISYGASSTLPLPLIYLTNGVHAKQWAYLSQYSVNQHGYPMNITGVFTQSQYCEQFGWCNGTDNTPEEAYQQLSYELSKHPDTDQYLRWKTDIHWILQSEITESMASADAAWQKSGWHPVQNEILLLEEAIEKKTPQTTAQTNLSTKLDYYQTLSAMIILSMDNAAPKDMGLVSSLPKQTDPVFVSGIKDGGMIAALPYEAVINNTWQTQTEDGYLQIAAGASSDAPEKGILFILKTFPDKTVIRSLRLETQENHGALTILNAINGTISIRAEDGTGYAMDLQTLILKEVSP